MKAITLTQPWATLVAIGAKRIETRSWRTPYVGDLAIHAAKGCDEFSRSLFTNVWGRNVFAEAMLKAGVPHRKVGDDRYTFDLPLGAFVALSHLFGCARFKDDGGFGAESITLAGAWSQFNHIITDQEICFGNFDDGRYGLLLERVNALKAPIPFRGALGLWGLPPSMEREIRESVINMEQTA